MSKKYKFILILVCILFSTIALLNITASVILKNYEPKPFETLNIIDIQNVFDDNELNNIKTKLESIFTFNVNTSRRDVDLHSAYNQKRKQYDVDLILKALKKENRNEKEYSIYVLNGDIYRGYGNFLFSHTDFNKSVTIASMWRFQFTLKEDNYRKKSILENRFYKILLRRIGIMFQLNTDSCVMKFSNSLKELDALNPEYCSDQKTYLIEKNILKEPTP